MEVVYSKVYAVMNAASNPYSVLVVILLISNIFTYVRFEALCMAIFFVRSIFTCRNLWMTDYQEFNRTLFKAVPNVSVELT